MHESVIRVRNQVEVLLEQAQIKLSSVATDLLGKSGRRILDALVRSVSDPVELARDWATDGCMPAKSNS
jgi:hypothetical protein